MTLKIYFLNDFGFGCAACGLSLVAESEGYPLLWCMGSSLQWLLAVDTGSRRTGLSVVAARGLGSCGTRA